MLVISLQKCWLVLGWVQWKLCYNYLEGSFLFVTKVRTCLAGRLSFYDLFLLTFFVVQYREPYIDLGSLGSVLGIFILKYIKYCFSF